MKQPKSYMTPPGELLTVTPKTECKITDGAFIANIISQSGMNCRCVNVSVAPQVVHYDMSMTDILQYNESKLNRVLKAVGARCHSTATLTSSNKGDFGIDMSRAEKGTMYLRSGLYTVSFNNASQTSCAVGVDTSNQNVVIDIANAPHILIAGETGSGKSVLLNSLICSLMYKATPAIARFVMIDPKQVELSKYEGLPHLYRPIVTDANTAVSVLSDLCIEMDRRYTVMRSQGVKDITGTGIPRLYVFIDELSDLMLTSKKSVENSIVRIAQKGRAAGIHLIIATQRPSSNVVTGLIKANIPTKIALSVSNIHDSMVILNHGGAEKLTGRGDAILKSADSIKERRFQAYLTPDDDIERIVEYYKSLMPKKRGLFKWLSA